jgi:hypothetical protein
LNSSPIIIKSRLRWAGNVARILEIHTKSRNHSEDPDVDKGIILDWILEKWDVNLWTRFIWLKIGISDRLVNTVMNLRVP